MGNLGCQVETGLVFDPTVGGWLQGSQKETTSFGRWGGTIPISPFGGLLKRSAAPVLGFEPLAFVEDEWATTPQPPTNKREADGKSSRLGPMSGTYFILFHKPGGQKLSA